VQVVYSGDWVVVLKGVVVVDDDDGDVDDERYPGDCPERSKRCCRDRWWLPCSSYASPAKARSCRWSTVQLAGVVAER
jgi:hypothetical protein